LQGLFVNSDTIPPYFDWIKYLSPIKYAFTALARNEYEGLVMTSGGQSLRGDDVIRVLGFETQGTPTFNDGILLLLFGGLISASYIALHLLVHHNSSVELNLPSQSQSNGQANAKTEGARPSAAAVVPAPLAAQDSTNNVGYVRQPSDGSSS
jgi:hypothetical protein